jgi:transcriptional regulator with XRE-family HTH domain
MAESAFGVFLRRLREKRGLSFREVAQLAGVDHAYVYRLETGEKESPSDDALTKLARALKATKRDTDLLRQLPSHPSISTDLLDFVLADQTVTAPEVIMLASVVNRGPSRRDYDTMLKRIRSILGSEGGG